MNERTFLMVMVAGLFLTVGTLGMAQKPAPPEEEKTYARVELKGRLIAIPIISGGGPGVEAGKQQFRLDLSGHKNLQNEESWRKLEGKTLLVMGTLKLPRNNSEMATVYVETLRVLDE